MPRQPHRPRLLSCKCAGVKAAKIPTVHKVAVRKATVPKVAVTAKVPKVKGGTKVPKKKVKVVPVPNCNCKKA